MKTIPRQHQIAAIEKSLPVLNEHGFFGLLMDMGTGKTRTTIEIVEKLHSEGKINSAVIVVPNIGVDTWIEQFPFHSDYEKVNYWGEINPTTQKYTKHMIEFFKRDFSIYVINVEAFQNNSKHIDNLVKAFKKRNYLIAVDESSVIKNPSANRTKRVSRFGKTAKYKMILTGTEISHNLSDLYSQIKFLDDNFWVRECGIYSAHLFKHTFDILKKIILTDGHSIDTILKFNEMSKNQKELYSKNLKKIYDIIDHYVFRVRKEDCYDLPPKIYEKIHFDLSKNEKIIYTNMKDDLYTFFDDDVFTSPNEAVAFLRARMITGGWLSKELPPIESIPSKLKALIEHIQLYDKQAIIGCCFTHEVDFIASALTPYGKVSKFYGGNVDERDEEKRKFISGETRFFVCNISAASKSLNLQNCDLVYRYTRSLSPIDESQFEDRVYRDGTTQSPLYIDLIARNTVDSRVENIINGSIQLRELFQGLGKKDFINNIF